MAANKNLLSYVFVAEIALHRPLQWSVAFTDQTPLETNTMSHLNSIWVASFLPKEFLDSLCFLQCFAIG